MSALISCSCFLLVKVGYFAFVPLPNKIMRLSNDLVEGEIICLMKNWLVAKDRNDLSSSHSNLFISENGKEIFFSRLHNKFSSMY